MTNKGRSNNRTFCEKVMKMIVNITKVSVLSLAELSLGTDLGVDPVTANHGSEKGSLAVLEAKPVMPSQSLTSKPYSYVIEEEPVETQETSKILKEKSIDEKAGDFISKIQKRNKFESMKT